jgi:predicted P-loop ATPase
MTEHAGGLVLPGPDLILQAASTYCQMGWVPVATYCVTGSTESGRPICSCYQGADCKNAGKHPIGKYANVDTPAKGYNHVFAALQVERSKGLSCNLAIRTGPMSGIFVVDLDVKEGQNGYAEFERWLAARDLSYADIEHTCTARSGSGGWHFVFKHPPNVELKPSNSDKVFGPGIDIKSGGMPFHVYPSIHKYGGQYTWVRWVEPVDAPEAVWKAAQKQETYSFDSGENYTPSKIELRDYAETLKAARKGLHKEIGKNLSAALAGDPIALEGGGHDAFRDLAFFILKKWPTANPDALLDYIIPSIEARLEAVQGANTDIENVRQAFRSAANKLEEHRKSWSGRVVLTETGQPLALDSNLLLFFENHPAWQGVFAYNARRNKPEYLRPPPIERETRVLDMTRDRTDINRWFHTLGKFSGRITSQDLNSAILSASSRFEYDPLQQAVMSLHGAWDGVPRLETLFQRVGGTLDDAWVQTVAPLWFKSLIARILWPGCKADTMLILEGPQGYKKSSFFRSVLPDASYFSDTLNRVHLDVETIRLLHSGPAIFELGEVSGLKKQEVEEIKAFLSASEDNLRPLYENYRTTPRRCIFVGTTNRDDYLRDETGGRRFWPLKVTRPMDLSIVESERAQWFAEALHRLIVNREPWWLDDVGSELAAAEQSARFEEDIWFHRIAVYLSPEKMAKNVAEAKTGTEQMTEMLNKKVAGNFVTVMHVAENALGIELKNAKGAEGARINRIIRKLGWISDRDYVNDVRVRGWKRPEKP